MESRHCGQDKRIFFFLYSFGAECTKLYTVLELILKLKYCFKIPEGKNHMSYHLLHFAGIVILSVFVLEVCMFIMSDLRLFHSY